MSINTRPTYGETIGNIVERGGKKVVIFTDQFEKFIDDLIQEVANSVAGVTQITNQQQLVEGGSGGDDEIEPPTLLVQPVVQTTVVINHLHMDGGSEDQPEPMFVPGR